MSPINRYTNSTKHTVAFKNMKQKKYRIRDPEHMIKIQQVFMANINMISIKIPN